MKSKSLHSSLKRVTALAKVCSIPAFGAAIFLSFVPVLGQAQDDGASQINAALAQDIVMQLLPSVPNDLGLASEDYVSGNDHTASTRRVTVQIGPDGQMMPSVDWQKNHPAQCKKQARETNSASQRLTFEMLRITESLDGLTRHQYFTTVRLIDAESNIVRKKADGESTVGQISSGTGGLMDNPDADGLPDALGKAMQSIGVNLGAPTDGCGDIRLTHQFGSSVDEEFGFVAGYQNESGPNVTYEWDFGDGFAAGSGDQLGRHIYTQEGAYTVTVHVSGEGVRDGSASIAVLVKEEEEKPIQPRNGAWTITLNSHDTQGCAPKIAAAIKTAMTTMIGQKSSETLTFETSFHPKPLMQHAKGLEWEQTGTNTWKTVVADMDNKNMSHKVVLEIEVMSPTLIEEVQTHRIKMSKTLAMAMGGTRNCLGTGDFDLILEQ